MSIQINNWINDNRVVVSELGAFKVIEHQKDLSVSRVSAQNEYFSSQMNVRCRQVEITLDGNVTAKTQAGAMQMLVGDVAMDTGVKSAKDSLDQW